MSARAVSLAVAALFAVVTGHSVHAGSSAATSTYFRTVDAEFQTNNKDGSIAFHLILETLKPLPQDAELVATFQNPANPSQPLIVATPAATATLKSGRGVELRSPPVSGLKANAAYLISVRLYADKSRKTLLGTHDQRVTCRREMLEYVDRLKTQPKH